MNKSDLDQYRQHLLELQNRLTGDVSHLEDEALRKSGGDAKKLAAAVKAAGSEFKSVRGPFRFNNNNLPVQNYYAFEAVKEGGKLAIKQIATPLKEHLDAYHTQCGMK